MDPKRLLTLMAERLYEDIRFVTEQNPTQIVDDDGARAYNSIISRVRKLYPYVENVADFPDWSPRTIKYKDALVVAGQLAAMLRALLEPAGPMRQPGPQQGGPPISQSTQGVPNLISAPTSLGLVAQTSVPVGQVGNAPIPRPATQNISPSSQGYPRQQMPQGPQQQAGNIPSSSSPIPPPPGRQQEPVPAVAPNPHDPELYGPNRPPRRNTDGTIPFSME